MTLNETQLDLLRQVAEAMPHGIAFKDRSQRYQVANEAFAEASGLKPDEVIGKTDAELEQRPTPYAQRAIDRVRSDLLSVGFSECPNLPDSAQPLSDARGEVIGYLVQPHDSALLEQLKRSLDESIAMREDQMSVLNELMERMMAYQQLDPLLQHIAEVMIHRTQATNALILLVDDTEEYIHVVASAGSHSSQNIGQRRERGVGFAGIAWATAEPQNIPDSDANDKTRGFWPPKTQLLAVPLLDDDRVIGVVVLGAPNNGLDLSRSTGLANNLAQLAGIAITNAQAREQARSELERTRAMSDISRHVASHDGEASLISSVSKTLIDAMEIDWSVGYRVNINNKLVWDGGWSRTSEAVIPAEPVSEELIEGTIYAWCLRQGQFAYIRRNEKDPRESPDIHLRRSRLNIGCTLCMPITSGNRPIGTLSVSRDRSKRNFDENEVNAFRSIVNQVSSAMYSQQLSSALHHQAFHDSLTQLPNRRHFESNLEQLIERHTTADAPIAVLFLDLDGFKLVNDTLGHSAGDELLRQVASRLDDTLRDIEKPARLGGDEFAVLLPQLDVIDLAMTIAERLRDAVSKPFSVGNEAIGIGVSIGLSLYPDDAGDKDSLLHNADNAMYQAKSLGKNRVVRYHHDMGKLARQRASLKADFREALLQNQFLVHYQPQLDLSSGQVVALEALARWNHPKRGLVSPGVFIPLAEEAGMIYELGAWVLEAVLAQMEAWKDTFLKPLRVAVNVAAPQFLQEGFCEFVMDALRRHAIEPSRLELEVTESVVMADVRLVIQQLARFRSMGIRIAVDDFGTGYSSLSYLQDLPLDALKIDRSFISRLENESTHRSLTNTIVLLARGLGLATVAEGVETEQQLEKVKQLGCTLVQGYYFAKPCSAVELSAVIERINEDESVFPEQRYGHQS